MGVLRVAEGHGVEFGVIRPAGFRILAALDQVANGMPFDLFITSGTDGVHSGPTDPHKLGEAYDVQSHGHTPKEQSQILHTVMGILGWGAFFGFLEDEGKPNEHFHFQRARGTSFPQATTAFTNSGGTA
jgi:hypothetical protein